MLIKDSFSWHTQYILFLNCEDYLFYLAALKLAMKLFYYLCIFSIIFVSCSKDKISTPKVTEPEQRVFTYDSLWQRAEEDRVLPANGSQNSIISKKYLIQGKTIHLVGKDNGIYLCEYDGTNWTQSARIYSNSVAQHKNTLYVTSAYMQTGQKFETKVLDPATFTFTNYSQDVPASLDENVQYYANATRINDTLYLILTSALEKYISALKFNETTHKWEAAVLKHAITSFILYPRVHEGLAGETLLSGRTTDGDFVYKFNGDSFEIIHKLRNYTSRQGDGYFDIIPYNNKYIIADGGSGTLLYLDGMTATSEAFPPQGSLQHFTIKGNYACAAAGSVSATDFGITKLRFYNLTNKKVAIFNPYIYEYGKKFRIKGMEAPWIDYTFENDQIQMLGSARILYANFTGARAAIKLYMPVKLP